MRRSPGLATVTAADFAGLGLEDRLVGKIFANLVFRGYANADGTLVEDALPVAADGFCLAGDFTAVHDELFVLIGGLCLAEAEDAETPGADTGAGPPAGQLADQAPCTDHAGTGYGQLGRADAGRIGAGRIVASCAGRRMQPARTRRAGRIGAGRIGAGCGQLGRAHPYRADAGHGIRFRTDRAAGRRPGRRRRGSTPNGAPPAAVSFFPSDLEALTGLPADQRAELYDNLVFNGYLEPRRHRAGPEFFTDPDNASAFTVNADLFGVGPAVLARIRQCYAHFDRAPLTLTTAVFAALGLTDSQLADLLENLRFNGYLDRGNAYVDKGALLGLSPRPTSTWRWSSIHIAGPCWTPSSSRSPTSGAAAPRSRRRTSATSPRRRSPRGSWSG